MTFYEIFVSLCESVGKKPNTVGKELGIGSSIITQWKNGSVPSTEKVLSLADYFNVSADFILGRTINPITNAGNSVSGNSNSGNNSISVGAVPKATSVETQDSLISEFLKRFEKLDFEDKLEIMNLTTQKLKKSA